MTHEPDPTLSTSLGRRVSRRTVVRTAAWSVPAVSVISAAPAFAVSECAPGAKTWNFDDLANGQPAGVKFYTSASSTARGTEYTTYATTATAWNGTSGGFRNMASATGLTSSATVADQAAATDRAIAVRQVAQTNGTFPNSDPGASFEFALGSTVGKTAIQAAFNLQSLDVASVRQTTWTVDAWVDGSPIAASSITGILTTGGTTFGSSAITATFPATVEGAADVYIRVYTAAASTGTGNRASTGIDNMSISWACPQPPRA